VDQTAGNCIKLPQIPKIPAINVLGMADLKGMLDFSLGAQRDCSLTINLMLQLAPMLASMTCLLKILAVINAMQEFVNDPLKTKNLLEKIGDMLPCFAALAPPNIIITVKGVLQLIVSFLSCFLDQLSHLVDIQASIDLDAAEGNPALQLSLKCAQDNAQTAMDNLTLSLAAIQPLLDITASLAGMAHQDLVLPELSALSGQAGQATAVVEGLNQTVTSLKQALDSLP